MLRGNSGTFFMLNPLMGAQVHYLLCSSRPLVQKTMLSWCKLVVKPDPGRRRPHGSECSQGLKSATTPKFTWTSGSSLGCWSGQNPDLDVKIPDIVKMWFIVQWISTILRGCDQYNPLQLWYHLLVIQTPISWFWEWHTGIINNK